MNTPLSKPIVRPYTETDLEDCRCLWAELTQRHREIYNDPSIGGENPGLYFDHHLETLGAEHIWVAELDGRVVGLVGLVMRENEAEIDPLVIARQQRGMGIGKALMAIVEEEARQKKVRYLSVRPVARNLDAIGFYYHDGFQSLGQIEMFKELLPSEPGKWKSGIDLFGMTFDF